MNQQNLFENTQCDDTRKDEDQKAAVEASDLWSDVTLVFFDTETTGLSPDARLCQLAYKINGAEEESLFKPPVPIEPGASAVTGITDDTVANEQPFIGSDMAKKFMELVKKDGVFFIAHNAAFDIEMLAREGIVIERYFDTLRLARAIDDGNAKNYKQEYLREYYDLRVENATAHDALGDVRVLEALFEKLSQIVREKDASADVIASFWKIMEEPIIYKKMTFGKYRGRDLAEVASEDPGYLEWLLAQKRDGEMRGDDGDWVHTINYHLGKEE